MVTPCYGHRVSLQRKLIRGQKWKQPKCNGLPEPGECELPEEQKRSRSGNKVWAEISFSPVGFQEQGLYLKSGLPLRPWDWSFGPLCQSVII